MAEANDPTHQWLLRWSLDLDNGRQLDLTLRHVGKLSTRMCRPTPPWICTCASELSLWAWNLLGLRHPEFGKAPTRAEVERSVYLKWTLRY